MQPDGRVFVGPYGVTPARPNFSPVWTRALKKAGLTGIHVHDLRHTGESLRCDLEGFDAQLMGRMGSCERQRGVGLAP